LTTKQSRIISTVLSPALNLWLRSQVSQVEDLQIKIEGGDRQILSGHVPGVSILAAHAVYQGIYVSKVQLKGENIRINLGQVIKGKPLRLLEPIPVSGQLRLEAADLKASLQSPLLSNAFTELLSTLLQAGGVQNPTDVLNDYQITWQQATLEADQFTLVGEMTEVNGTVTPIVIRSGLQLASSHELRLAPLEIQMNSAFPINNLDSYHIDLGTEVDLEELNLTPGQLICRGSLKVIP